MLKRSESDNEADRVMTELSDVLEGRPIQRPDQVADPGPPPPREPGGYSTAVVVRVHPEERDQLNADARAAELSLQNYCRRALGLALPEVTRAPYNRSGRRR